MDTRHLIRCLSKRLQLLRSRAEVLSFKQHYNITHTHTRLYWLIGFSIPTQGHLNSRACKARVSRSIVHPICIMDQRRWRHVCQTQAQMRSPGAFSFIWNRRQQLNSLLALYLSSLSHFPEKGERHAEQEVCLDSSRLLTVPALRSWFITDTLRWIMTAIPPAAAVIYK